MSFYMGYPGPGAWRGGSGEGKDPGQPSCISMSAGEDDGAFCSCGLPTTNLDIDSSSAINGFAVMYLVPMG